MHSHPDVPQPAERRVGISNRVERPSSVPVCLACRRHKTMSPVPSLRHETFDELLPPPQPCGAHPAETACQVSARAGPPPGGFY